MGLTRVRRLGARWCCQLCVKLVSELSNQCCSHLRSWQSAVVCEPQTHFRITPLSLISLHYPFSAHFIPHSSSVHSSLSFLLSLPFLATFLLFCLLYFPTCAPPLPPLYDSVVSHPFSQNTLPGFLHPSHFLSLGFLPPYLQILFFSTSHFTTTSTFHCLQLKMCLLQRWQEMNVHRTTADMFHRSTDVSVLQNDALCLYPSYRNS